MAKITKDYPIRFDEAMNNTEDGVAELCELFEIPNYEIIKSYDGYVVSVGAGKYKSNNTVDLSDLGLVELPLRFLEVNGVFDISNNDLVTLDGCPEVVCWFDCSHNHIEDLELGPIEFYKQQEIIKGSGRSTRNSGKKLGPDYYTGYYNCSYNNIRSWSGLPNVINHLVCDHNPAKFTMEDWQDSVSGEAGQILPPRYLNGKYFSDVKDIENLYTDSRERLKSNKPGMETVHVSNSFAKVNHNRKYD